MALPKKLTKQWRKSLSSKYPFPKLVLNKKNKNEYTEYHGISIPLKSQVYSKHGSPTFFSFGSWSLVLYLHVLVKAIFFWVIRFSDGVYTFYKKNVLVIQNGLIKMFYLQQSRYLKFSVVEFLFIRSWKSSIPFNLFTTDKI